MSTYNPFDVSTTKEKKSLWSNPTTPLGVSQFKNDPIKSTAKPLDLNIKRDTSEDNLPFDATKAGILKNTITGIPKAAKDLFLPTRGYKEEELKKAKPTFFQQAESIPKIGAEIFGGMTKLGEQTLGEYLSDIKSLQKFSETKVGGKIADIGEGVKAGTEKLYQYSQPKTVEEAKAMRIADLGTFFVGELKLGGTSASLIAKTKNPSKIFNILKTEIPGVSDEGASVLTKILTEVDNVDDVQKVINRTNFAINNGKDLTPPKSLAVKPLDPKAAIKKRADELIKENIGDRKITPEFIKQAEQRAEQEALENIKNTIGGDMAKIEKRSTDYVKVGDKFVVPPKQVVSKTKVKEMVNAMGGEIDFKVVEEGGQKYLGFFDGKVDIMLKPTALGIADDSVEVGQAVNINSNDLKATGTRFTVEETTPTGRNPFDVSTEVEKPTEFLYRGQPEEFKDVQKVAQSDVVDNILIGRGIFTTTDEAIAKSYGPNVFRFEKPTGKIFDLTKASEIDLRKILPDSFFEERRLGGLIHRPDDIITSTYKTYKNAIKNGDIKDAEDILFESMADKYLPDNVTWEEVKNGATAVSGEGPLVDIVRDNLLKDLTENGFDWMKHQGGIRAGTKEHDVYIALKDEVLKNSTTTEKPKPIFSEPQKQPIPEVGQAVNINSNDLKATGTRFTVEETTPTGRNPFDVAPQGEVVKPIITEKPIKKISSIVEDTIKDFPSNVCNDKGSCMIVTEKITNNLLKNNINDFNVVEGYLDFGKGFTPEHTWIELKDGTIIDKTISQFNGWDLSKVKYQKDNRNTFTPDEYLKLSEKYPVSKPQPTPIEKPKPIFSEPQKQPTPEASIRPEDSLTQQAQTPAINKKLDKTYKDSIPEISEDVYKQNRSVGSSKRTFKGATKENIGSIKHGVDKILGVISTRLKNLDISLKREIRRFEYNLSQSTVKDSNAITPFMKKVSKDLSKNDAMDLDLALKNRDSKKIDQIIKDNNLEKEYGEVRKTLDDIHKRATDIGFDINYMGNYFPREVDKPVEFLKYLEEKNGWKEIDQAIKEKEEELGRYLNANEKASIADSYIVPAEKVLVQTGAMKPRSIDFIGSEINRFYKDSTVALNHYIETMNDAIESWKFFNLDTKVNKFTKLDNTIGSYVFKKLNDGVITPEQSDELTRILKSRFADVGTSGFTTLYKNLSYIDTMGSPISAITQIGDLGFSLYRAGFLRTGKEIAKSIFNKSDIKRSDIGIDRIAQEFNDPGLSAKALDFTFKATGLEKLDAIGKEALINAVISKYRKQALNPTPDFMRRITEVFGDEAPKVIENLKSGEITENVKYLAFNELLDIQPLKLSEMPEQYLKGGNGRIFYMLKTYTIKLFDVYRNEIFHEMKRNKVSGIKNLIYLTSALVIANATADEIKDFILGRETSLSDRVVDNLLRLVGFSKWTIYKARMEGLASATVKTILPPTKFLDSLYKDITKDKEIKDLEVYQSIPLVGKLYYWWFGKGAEKSKAKKGSLKSRSF